jgi:hypothetical protein
MRDQVSQPYKTASKIVILCILIESRIAPSLRVASRQAVLASQQSIQQHKIALLPNTSFQFETGDLTNNWWRHSFGQNIALNFQQVWKWRYFGRFERKLRNDILRNWYLNEILLGSQATSRHSSATHMLLSLVYHQGLAQWPLLGPKST